MSNYYNYILHKTVDPSYYHRQYEHDLPSPRKNDDASLPLFLDDHEKAFLKSMPQETWGKTAQRAALIALPFISLYKPVGQKISNVMGTCRIATNFSEA